MSTVAAAEITSIPDTETPGINAAIVCWIGKA